MKSLEKVITLKSRLIDVRKPESNNISEVFTQHHTGKKLIYLVNDLNNQNIIELVQQIASLIYHLISRYRKEEEKSLVINLEIPPSKALLNFPREFKINDENPLNSIQEFIKDFKSEDYFITLPNILIFKLFLKTRKPKNRKLKNRIPLKSQKNG